MTPSTRTTAGQDTVASLRARLARLEREAAARERQLEAYAADLREVFKQERARAQELRRSYKATVLALANAVEARDAYTGRHAQRVAAYGLRIAHAAGVEVDAAGRVRLPAPRHRQGRRARRDPLQARPAHRRGARADDRAPRRSAGRSCATSTSSTTRRPSCATTTSGGTAAATPTGSRARRSRSTRACSRWPTRSTR